MWTQREGSEKIHHRCAEVFTDAQKEEDHPWQS